MRKVLVGVLGAGVMALGLSRPAEASLFISLTDGTTTVSCDNGSAAGVTACGTAGFATTLNGSTITILSPITVGGYDLAGLTLSTVTLGSSNSHVTDTKTDVQNVSDTHALTVDFGAYNLTIPPGPQLDFSASQTANWTTSSTGSDTSAFNAWADANNDAAVGIGVEVTSPTLTSPGGATIGQGSSSPDTTFTRLATPFSLTGQEIITEAIGADASFSGTSIVNAVPEPTSMLLLGTGLFGLAGLRRRLAKK